MVAAGRLDQAEAASVAMYDPYASAAIIQLSRRDVAKVGLAFDRCAVSIVVREQPTAGADGSVGGADAAIVDLLKRHSQVHLMATNAPEAESAVRGALADRT